MKITSYDILVFYVVVGVFTVIMLLTDILNGARKYENGIQHILQVLRKDAIYWLLSLFIALVFWPVVVYIKLRETKNENK